MDLAIDLKFKLELHAKWLLGEEGGQRADLQHANLQRANLQRANLQGANLQGANLQGADLQGANLQRANLQRADLQGANLQGANLQRADLQGADLQGANLQGANLDLSAWPLRCGSFHAKGGKRLFAQLLKHIAMLNVTEAEPEVQEAMTAIRSMPASSWFDEYRDDLARTPEK